MNKKEMDKLRSSCLYSGEVLYVKHIGNFGHFIQGKIYEAIPRFQRNSGLPYPKPKWIACEYQIYDEEGDMYPVAKDRYGELKYGFEWCRSGVEETVIIINEPYFNQNPDKNMNGRSIES